MVRSIKKIIKILLYLTIVSFYYSCSNYKNNNKLIELGNKYYIEHNYEEAQKNYEAALQKGSKSFEVFHNLGSIYYYEKKEFKKAEKIFKEGVKLYPRDDILHFSLSQLYFDMNNLSEAKKEYEMAVRFVKGRPITINAIKAKELLKREGKSEKEIYDFFTAVINTNPKDSYALYEVAEYEKTMGNWNAAIEIYTKIIHLNPHMRNAVLGDMGVCYYKLGDNRQGKNSVVSAEDSAE